MFELLQQHFLSIIYIYILPVQFEHSLGLGGEPPLRALGLSLFALCIAHCSQFEHSGDFIMQSKQCVNAHPVSQVWELP